MTNSYNLNSFKDIHSKDVFQIKFRFIPFLVMILMEELLF